MQNDNIRPLSVLRFCSPRASIAASISLKESIVRNKMNHQLQSDIGA